MRWARGSADAIADIPYERRSPSRVDDILRMAMSRPTELDPIAVMGAGAVGCYYGGMLARAGHDVTLIARAQHVEAVRKSGLRMETKAFDANVPRQASAEASGARGAKLVVFLVEATGTERGSSAH